MTNEKKKGLNAKNLAFYGIVAIALIVIGYYFFNPKQEVEKNSSQAISTSTSESSTSDSSVQNNRSTATPEPTPTTNAAAVTTQNPKTEKSATTQDSQKVASASQDNGTQSSQPTNSNSQDTNQGKQSGTNSKQAVSPATQPETVPSPSPKVEPTAKPIEAAIKILKSEVTSQAEFYPYKLDNINMEVIAVKASDGTIRTALNTCQVCYDSGRGYYVQVGEYLVCQNCRNKFHIDQVEKVKGGCNPVPILEESKKDLGDTIVISKDYLASQKEYFSNWKKQ